jgi:hypothetical protein
MLKITHMSYPQFNVKVLESRLAKGQLELIDVAALLEEVKRLQLDVLALEAKLADAESQLAEALPVWEAYRGVANFTEMAEVLHTLMKRMDHTIS